MTPPKSKSLINNRLVILVLSKETKSNSPPVGVGVSIICLIMIFFESLFAFGGFIKFVIVSPRHLG